MPLIRGFLALCAGVAGLSPVQPCEASRLGPDDVAALLARHAGAVQPKAGTGATRFVYLYPTDRPLRTDYLEGVRTSAETLQDWYAAELGGYTPTLAQVTAVALDHPADFYGQPTGEGDPYLTFWNKVLDDALPKTGAAFNDPGNVWVFFVDAPAGCGQLSGGGTSGIAVMSHNDLRGLLGEGALACDGSPAPADTFPPNRWIGGQGHELGHAYGLPHPPGCDEGLATCDHGALMWTGFYAGFPSDTYLRAEEKTFLINGPYVQDAGLSTPHVGTQFWLTGAGLLEGSVLRFELHSATGTAFGDDFDAAQVQRRRWGEMEIVFTGCDTAQMQWSSSGPDTAGFGDGGYPLQRLAPSAASLACQQSGFADVDGVQWVAGSWFGGAERSGEGLFLDVLANGVVVVAFFTHRPAD